MGSKGRSSLTIDSDDDADRSSEYSRSIHSFSSSRRRFSVHDKTRQKWDNYWEFIIVSVCSTLPMESFEYFLQHGRSTAFHFLISFLIVGLPMVYMEIVVGQFTQLGITRIKFICPMAHGLGYTFVIATVVRTVRSTYYMSDALIYFMSSFQTNLQWGMCPPRNKTNCWQGREASNCKSNCLTDGVILSAYIYYTKVYLTLEDEQMEREHVEYGWPTVARFFMLLLVCVLLFVALIYGIHQYRKFIVANGIFVMCGLYLLFFATLISDGAVNGLANVFFFDVYTFYDIKCWTKALVDTVEILTLGRGIYTMHGSQLQTNAPAGVLTIGCVSISYKFACLGACIMHTCIGIIMHQAYMTDIDGREMIKVCYKFNFFPTIFSVIPQGLSYLPVSQFWTTIYFAVLIVIGLNNQIINILLIEKSVTDSFPRMMRYRNYTIGAICCALFTLSLMTSCKEMFALAIVIFRRNAKLYELLNTFLLSIIVFWIYRVVKLSDDIHFFTGSQPTKFWRFCWWGMPLFLFHPSILYMYFYFFQINDGVIILHSCAMLAIFMPLPILLVYEIFQHLKSHNLIGLFHCQERWGPADPEERQIRRLFNPRQEIRSRRRNETCMHKCLITNKTIRSIVEEEIKTRQEREECGYTYQDDLFDNAALDSQMEIVHDIEDEEIKDI